MICVCCNEDTEYIIVNTYIVCIPEKSKLSIELFKKCAEHLQYLMELDNFSNY